MPSATEIVCALGLGDRLVGVTHECDYPPRVRTLPQVTRSRIPKGLASGEIDRLVSEQLEEADALYSIDMSLLQQLGPDLIITQALCDVCAVSESEVQYAVGLLKNKPQLINLEPMSLQEVFDTIRLVGETTGIVTKTDDYLRELQARVEVVRSRSAQLNPGHLNNTDRPRVAFLEWIEPLFNAGHWTPELVELAGGMDCLGNKHQPSQRISFDRLLASQPDVLVIAICGFDLKRSLEDINLLKKMKGWTQLPCVKQKRIYLIDGNSYFSRSGPRLVDSLEILAHCLFPEAHPLPAHLMAAIQIQS